MCGSDYTLRCNQHGALAHERSISMLADLVQLLHVESRMEALRVGGGRLVLAQLVVANEVIPHVLLIHMHRELVLRVRHRVSSGAVWQSSDVSLLAAVVDPGGLLADVRVQNSVDTVSVSKISHMAESKTRR